MYQIRIKHDEYPAATWMLHSAHETPQLAADVAANLPGDMTWIILYEAPTDADYGMPALPAHGQVPGAVGATGLPLEGDVLPSLRPCGASDPAGAVA